MKLLKCYIEYSTANGGYGTVSLKLEMDDKEVVYVSAGDTLKATTLKPDQIVLQGKKLYRYPKISLPRAKVDTLKDKYDVSVVRSSDDADYKVISDTYLNSLITRSWYSIYPGKTAIEFFEKYRSQFNPDYVNVIDTIKSIYEEEGKLAVMIRHNFGWSYNQNASVKIELPETTGEYFYVEDKARLTEILLSKNLVLDTDIASITTEDSVVFTETDYNNIQKMLDSSDKENITLALEMMANCNIEKSLDFVSWLFYNNYNLLKDYSTNWSSVNIKTLRKRLQSYIPYGQRNTVHHYDNYLKALLKENYLTEFAFKNAAVGILQFFSNSGINANSLFTVDLSAIQLKPEIKEQMIMNEHGKMVINEIRSVHLPF